MSRSRNFDHIFQQLVLVLRLAGIPLDCANIESKLLRFWSIGIGLISFFLDISINLWSLVVAKKPQATRQWNVFISELNFGISLVLIHAVLAGRTAMRWKDLLLILERIEDLDILRPTDYVKIGKIFRLVELTSLISVASITLIEIALKST